jgi:hypothetical protein
VLRGSVRWANYPRRREDGVWTPDLRGVIRTEDGAEILISLHGQSVQEDPPDLGRRAILTRAEAPERARALSMAEHELRRGRGRDRRGNGSVVGADLRLRERGGPAPSRDRVDPTLEVPANGSRGRGRQLVDDGDADRSSCATGAATGAGTGSGSSIVSRHRQHESADARLIAPQDPQITSANAIPKVSAGHGVGLSPAGAGIGVSRAGGTGGSRSGRTPAGSRRSTGWT